MYKLFRRVEHTVYNEDAKGDIKIATISDIHYSQLVTPKVLAIIFGKLASLNPDYITIAGDLLDSIDVLQEEELRSNILKFIQSLSTIAPVIISYGNHDFSSKKDGKWVFGWNGSFWGEVASIPNVTIVDNSIYQDDKIFISGYTQPFDFYFDDKRESLPVMLEELKSLKDDLLKPIVSLPRICMIHSPYRLTEPMISKYFKNYDLFLCGHMHEGMVPPILDDVIRSNYGLIAPSKFLFPKNARGTIQTEYGQYIIISGGITKISEESPKILHPGNIFYPMSIEDITLTSDLEKVGYQKKIRYERGK